MHGCVGHWLQANEGRTAVATRPPGSFPRRRPGSECQRRGGTDIVRRRPLFRLNVTTLGSAGTRTRCNDDDTAAHSNNHANVIGKIIPSRNRRTILAGTPGSGISRSTMDDRQGATHANLRIRVQPMRTRIRNARSLGRCPGLSQLSLYRARKAALRLCYREFSRTSRDSGRPVRLVRKSRRTGRLRTELKRATRPLSQVAAAVALRFVSGGSASPFS